MRMPRVNPSDISCKKKQPRQPEEIRRNHRAASFEIGLLGLSAIASLVRKKVVSRIGCDCASHEVEHSTTIAGTVRDNDAKLPKALDIDRVPYF
jgi:hypothetical protein